MPDKRIYGPLLSSVLLLVVGVCCLYPFCQYYVDPDATAYLTISQRYAAGDYARAINGYWSPWSCWLTALVMKTGIAVIPASIVVNACAAAGMLIVTQSYFRLFSVQQRLQYFLGASLAGFLCYAVFKQNFADLWECLFLLCSLRIMLLKGYKANVGLWVLNGVIGALAYFAKAYAFPFFILNTICCGYLLMAASKKQNRMQWLKMSATAVLVMLVCSSPWLYLLHNKYGVWMTSTAGKLNASWYLVGHPYWKDSIHALLPPVYADSPYYWEDPYIVNGMTPGFLSSPKLFFLQIAKVLYNLLKLLLSGLQLSLFFIPVMLLAGAMVFSKKLRFFFNTKSRVLALSFLLFPLGFIIINFEARYIWYMLPLSMVIGGMALPMASLVIKKKKRRTMLMVAFLASYLVWPVWDMSTIIGKGRVEHAMAKQLNDIGISGSFTTLMAHGSKTQDIARLAYFSGNSYYMAPRVETTPAELLADMRRYKVKYYFKYDEDRLGKPTFKDELGNPFPELTGGCIPGIKVFQVNP